MVRILRWGSLVVLIAAFVAAGVSYPELRARILTPFLATPTPSPASVVLPLPTLPPTATQTAVVRAVETRAVRVAVADEDGDARPTVPAVVIVPPTAETHHPTPEPAPIVVAVATTSLLPETTLVLGPAIAAQPGGGGGNLVVTGTPKPILTTPQPTATVTPITVVSTAVMVTATAAVSAAVVTAPTPGQIPTRDPASLGLTSPLTPTATPIGPYAVVDGQLYAGPGTTYPPAGTVTAGQTLDILGWYTEGTWYLLANGLWLDAAIVGNPPSALPLVFPTPTFTPSPTPTITPTPTPTFTPLAPPTPSPTPTSLDTVICNCSSDQYDCLGSVFPSRAAAQLCFEYCYRQVGWDIHNLDPNANGQACENLR